MWSGSLTAVRDRTGKPSQLIVVTDLDGTLLDQQTYRYDACLPAIQRLQSLGIPLILCSSKTYAEIQHLWEELGLSAPFIVENGGAIYFQEQVFPFPVEGARAKGKFKILEFGTHISILRKALREAARQNGVELRSFGSMTLDEIARLTGLNISDSALAAKREYDEPFVIEGEAREKLYTALIAKGFTVVEGDRFCHLTGANDKGRAVTTLLELYRRSDPSVFSVGLGNSANDIGFLSQVDRPIVIQNPDGTWDPEVMKRIPTVQGSHRIGPQGWREAMEEVLGSVGL